MTNGAAEAPSPVASDSFQTADRVNAAKTRFKRLLLEHNGEASHPDVQTAMENLINLASQRRNHPDEWSPAQDKNLNSGRWKTVTTPPFPGKLPKQEDDDDERTKFTLGRMSFGMFKPTNSICAVNHIINVVKQLELNNDVNEEPKEGADQINSSWEQAYSFEVSMDILVPKGGSTIKLPAKLVTNGVCEPKDATKLGIKFTGGSLIPDFDLSKEENSTLVATWKEVFENAISKEDSQQSYFGMVKTYLVHTLMKWMMGLDPPVDREDFTQTYVITRPYVGFADIMYIDDDLRITKGNRGTIVVVERLKE
mmetsp:Transcript_21964/g.45760  ORF Transcript_21964/g.45760 Transcript_21964/m.45760 type:complete len:310 (+) Transcript_21964:228-1157(+)